MEGEGVANKRKKRTQISENALRYEARMYVLGDDSYLSCMKMKKCRKTGCKWGGGQPYPERSCFLPKPS